MDNQRRDEFFEENGVYIITPEKSYLFMNGAEAEASLCGYGVLVPPPTDPYQLAIKVCRYWELVAAKYAERFSDCKMYLSGTGFQPQCLYEAYTDDEKLAVLKEQERKARNTRTKYLAQKRKVKRLTPEWMSAAQQQDVRDRQRLSNFRQRVDSIQL